MRLSLRKTSALFRFKINSILKNSTIMVAPIMAIGFVFMMKFIMGQATSGEVLTQDQINHLSMNALTYGLLANVVMTGIMASSLPLAEEKEKHTLRVLMTSSVNGADFFMGSLLPCLLIMIVVNIVIVPFSGLIGINWILYLIVTTIASIVSLLMGAMVGLMAKDQMSASMLSTPFMLVFMMIPMFGSILPALESISGFTYTGALINVINNSLFTPENGIGIMNIVVMAVWMIVAIGLLLYAYKKNGMDND
ncbi:ABC transporter permease [Erysipelothrix sp. HDW6C]|uniref:ABC transporter permease n=1 Tax=Erysipelothrix sp. HDW6C TaxID=2714930 RepID=UPI001408A35C|nr:ABC transporter permease [Erysipelothrix sp. HDW6C]QIK69606.1 ABC transporter permease [Erysipelothrix sp. HDW6C]